MARRRGTDDGDRRRRGLRRLLQPARLRAFFQRNLGLKLFSVVAACFLWYSINVLERDAERVVRVPVTIRRVAQGLMVTNPPVETVAVTLSGPRTILDSIDESKTRLLVNLARVRPGDVQVDLKAANVSPELPKRIDVVRIQPARLRVLLERVSRKTLPVKVDLAGSPAFGYTVARAPATPSMVEVAGPAPAVEELRTIRTEPIDLTGVSQSTSRDVMLQWLGDDVTLTPDRVDVTIDVDENVVSRVFEDVRVRLPGGETGKVEPAVVDITIRGPEHLLHDFQLAEGAVSVDPNGLPIGRHALPVHVALPPRLEVAKLQPSEVWFNVKVAGADDDGSTSHNAEGES
jgi:YbbR domain-containing protein